MRTREAKAQYLRAWRASNRESYNAKARERRKRSDYTPKQQEYVSRPEVFRKRFDDRLRRTYGITLADYELLSDAQGGVCAICNRPETHPRNKYLAVDHCHVTGTVRGLLCADCNISLGKFQDNPETLIRAAEYLKKAGK